MSYWDADTVPGSQDTDSQSQPEDDDKHHHPGGHGRPGSPYPQRVSRSTSPETVTCVTTTASAVQVLVEQNINTTRPAPAKGNCIRPDGFSQRPTSIKWAENLPVPDRRLSSPPKKESVGSTSTLQASPTPRSKNSISQTCGKTPLNTPEHEEQRGEKEATLLEAKDQQENESQMVHISQLSQDSQKSQFPQHANAMTSVRRQKPPIMQALQDDLEAWKSSQDQSDTKLLLPTYHVSPLPPHLAHLAAAQESDPLTCEALDGLLAKHGDVAQSKKSHHSWTVSEGEDETSVNDGSSHCIHALQLEIPSSIVHWVSCLSSEPATANLQDHYEDFCRHGIDPETGDFMAYIEHPDTWVNFEEEKNMTPGELHRRREWTSNVIVRREIIVREKMEQRIQETREKEYKRSVVKGIQKLAVEPLAKAQVKATRSANAAMRAKPNKSGGVSSNAPKNRSIADVELRLGSLSDAKNCATIYNLAVSAHAPLPDNHPIPSQRFEFIFNECTREKLPFVVATAQRADLTDAQNWPSLDAYRQYMKWRQSQPEEEPTGSTMYGFAFLSPYERGLGFGSGAPAETVKATVFVHPEHRRHGVGSALLHRLLVETSILYHGGDIQYEWKEPVTHDTFERSSFRQVHRIIMHAMVDGERKKPDWMTGFMKSFQFEKAGHLNEVYKVVTPHSIQWYDQVIWIHWAKKASNGPVYDAGEESECSYDYPGKSCAQNRRVQQSFIDEDERPHGLGYA